MDVRLLFFFVLFLGQACQRYHSLAFFDIDQSHTLRVAADDPDIFDAQTYDLARVGDQHELIILGHLLRAHDTAGLIGRFHRDDTLAAARLQTILIGLRAFTEAVLGHRKYVAAETEYFHTDHQIAIIEPHTDDPVSSTAGWPDLFFLEADGLSIGGRKDDFLLAICEMDTNDLVFVFQGDGANPVRARIRIGHQLGFLYQALFCGKDNVTPFLELTDR